MAMESRGIEGVLLLLLFIHEQYCRSIRWEIVSPGSIRGAILAVMGCDFSQRGECSPSLCMAKRRERVETAERKVDLP